MNYVLSGFLKKAALDAAGLAARASKRKALSNHLYDIMTMRRLRLLGQRGIDPQSVRRLRASQLTIPADRRLSRLERLIDKIDRAVHVDRHSAIIERDRELRRAVDRA